MTIKTRDRTRHDDLAREKLLFITRPLVRGRSSRDRRHNEPDPTVGNAIYTTAAIETVRARGADFPVARVGGRVCIHMYINYRYRNNRVIRTVYTVTRPETRGRGNHAAHRGVDPARRRTKEKVCFGCARVCDPMS